MRFTLLVYAPSILLLVLAALGSHTPSTRSDDLLLRGAGALLFFAATFAAGVYWLVRLVRRAWSDGSAPKSESATSRGGSVLGL